MPSESLLRGQGIDPTLFNRGDYAQFQTWLGETKGVEGCPIDCTYCFFKLDGQTPKNPNVISPPTTIISRLADSPTYLPNIPINFGSQTDVFSTKDNIEYYTHILELYGTSDYPNPVVLITKRHVPNHIIELAKQIPQAVIFYISYSGLAGTPLEPNVSEQAQRNNFIRLHEANVPVVHYWRPFLPQNSTPDSLVKILDHVSRYANCSVVNGLRLNDGITKNLTPHWPELADQNFDYSTLGEVWPLGVQGNIHKLIRDDYPNYDVYFGNTTCSISNALDLPEKTGFYSKSMCLASNCSNRDRCQHAQNKLGNSEIASKIANSKSRITQYDITNDTLYVNEQINTDQLVYLRYLLGIETISNTVGYNGHNWANVTNTTPIKEVLWQKNT